VVQIGFSNTIGNVIKILNIKSELVFSIYSYELGVMVKRVVKNQNDNLILKPRKQMLNDLQIDHIIQRWKSIFKGYNFVWKSSSLEACMQEL
jgi:hypothetical protein